MRRTPAAPTVNARSGRGYTRRRWPAATTSARWNRCGRPASLRLVRVLQGARGGVRVADLSVGLAQGAPSGCLRGGVLTHDPGMYPKRLILDDARQHGVTVLGLDVNRSGSAVPGTSRIPMGIRLPVSEVKGISAAEEVESSLPVRTISLGDFWQRGSGARPTAENLIRPGLRRVARRGEGRGCTG